MNPNSFSPEESALTRSERNRAKLRAYQHVFMSILYLIIGGIVIRMQYFGTFELSGGMAYFLGGLFLLYGLFRLWRGLAELKALRRSP